MTVGNCLMCGDKLKYYDSVRRIVRTKSRKSRWIIVPRYQCVGCRCIRRYLPDYIYPYKQYESEIIDGVIEGLITCDTVGFEDYPRLENRTKVTGKHANLIFEKLPDCDFQKTF